jgi:hypothetical protein
LYLEGQDIRAGTAAHLEASSGGWCQALQAISSGALSPPELLHRETGDVRPVILVFSMDPIGSDYAIPGQGTALVIVAGECM